MCVSCGTIGLDKEGRLISCSQCGQSYHPYCVGFTKTVCCFPCSDDRYALLSSSPKLFLTKVGVVWIARRVNVAEKQPTKENCFYAMIVIYRIILTVSHHPWIMYRKAIGSVNGRVACWQAGEEQYKVFDLGVFTASNVARPRRVKIANGRTITRSVASAFRWVPVHYAYENIDRMN